MKVLCFGSLNIDYTYRVSHFVSKGETLAADSLNVFSGGKGMNQAVALARGGADTYMAGAVGEDGHALLGELQASGVNTVHVQILAEEPTGTAFIQNHVLGDNCILLYGGANRKITPHHVRRVIDDFQPGDWLVLQNEINQLPLIIEEGRKKGMKIVFNPSPMEEKVLSYPLELIDYLFLNRVEAGQLLGPSSHENREPADILAEISKRFPDTSILLTLGEQGAMLYHQGSTTAQPAFPARAVDTTGAGDTFTGYLVAGLSQGIPVTQAMRRASIAASMAVGTPGAVPSIPTLDKVLIREQRRE